MKLVSFLSLVLLVLYSCSSKEHKAEIITDSVQVNTQVFQGLEATREITPSTLKPRTFEEINQLLYDNFVNGGFGPFSFENDSGYQELGIDSYIEGLEDRGIFDSEFYEQERKRVQQCKEDLEELKYRGDTDTGWEPNSCMFFNFMYWLRSQESPDGFEIKNLTIADDSAHSSMVFYNEYEGERQYWNGHVYLEIAYRKTGDDWKITEIRRLPDE